MVFSSLLFVFVFLSLNIFIYRIVPFKYKNGVLLIFSLIFYMWGGPQYLILLIGETWISWYLAKRIESNRNKSKQYIILECIILLGLLGIFKYLTFIMENIKYITGGTFAISNIILPIGISFYTFQLISYVVDVYRKKVKAQPKFWKLLLYSSLFHQCIAGPIVRYESVANDIDNRTIKKTDVYLGIRRFTIGLAKKAVLANSCAVVADSLIMGDTLKSQAVLGLWLGMLFYMLQIYLDFSAYSDMAIGMGMMVGFHYPENFNYPYAATSVKDFWRRWHISLSTFFRDYVYIPLGGNRCSKIKFVRNMFMVWFLTGMWHGASWNYILWGLYYFVFLMIENFIIKGRLPKLVGYIATFIIVYFGWVIFKFENIADLGNVLSGMFGGDGRVFVNLEVKTIFLNNIFFLIIALIAVFPIGKLIRDKLYNIGKKNQKVLVFINIVDMLTPTIMLFLAVIALIGDSYNPFLYFQF